MPNYREEILRVQNSLHDHYKRYYDYQKEILPSETPAAKQVNLDNQVRDAKKLAVKLALLKNADKENAQLSLEEIDKQVEDIFDEGIPEYQYSRMERLKLVSALGEYDPLNPDPEKLGNANHLVDNLGAWIEESRKKEQYYKEYKEQFSKTNAEKLVGLEGDALLAEKKRQRLEKVRYVEEKYAKAEFKRLNDLQPEGKKLTGEPYTKFENDFIEVWNMNQAVKEKDYTKGLSTSEIFDMAVTASGNIQLGQQRVDMLKAWDQKTRGAGGNVPVNKSGAIARSYFFLYNFDETDIAKRENEQMIANLKSDDPEVNLAERKRLYTKYANKVLSLTDEMLTPKTPEEAAKVWEEHYPELFLAFESEHFLTDLDVVLPKEITEAMLHKSSLFQQNISKYKEVFEEQANPEQAKVAFMKKVGVDAIVGAMSDGHPHSFKNEEQMSIMATVGAAAKEDVFANSNNKEKVNPEKYDGLTFNGEFLTKAQAIIQEGNWEDIDKEEELTITQEAMIQDLKDRHFSSTTAEIKFLDSNGIPLEDGEGLDFTKPGTKIFADIYEPGDPLGKRMPITMDKMGRFAFAKPTVVSKERDLTHSVNTPREHMAELEKLQKLIKATDPFYVWSNSDQFARVRDGFKPLIEAQKALGNNPNMKQIRGFLALQDEFARVCGEYLLVKEDKLRNRTDDSRGRTRYDIVKSMQTLFSNKQSDKWLRGYKAYNEYAKSNDKVKEFRMKVATFNEDVFDDRYDIETLKEHVKDLVNDGRETFNRVKNDPQALASMSLSMSNVFDAMQNQQVKANAFTQEEYVEFQKMKQLCQQANRNIAMELENEPSLKDAIEAMKNPKAKEAPNKAQSGPERH